MNEILYLKDDLLKNVNLMELSLKRSASKLQKALKDKIQSLNNRIKQIYSDNLLQIQNAIELNSIKDLQFEKMFIDVSIDYSELEACIYNLQLNVQNYVNICPIIDGKCLVAGDIVEGTVSSQSDKMARAWVELKKDDNSLRAIQYISHYVRIEVLKETLGPKEEDVFEVGDLVFVLAVTPTGSLWLRGVIDLLKEQGLYKVVYLDFGNSELITKDKIISSPPGLFSNLPYQAICIQLQLENLDNGLPILIKFDVNDLIYGKNVKCKLVEKLPHVDQTSDVWTAKVFVEEDLINDVIDNKIAMLKTKDSVTCKDVRYKDKPEEVFRSIMSNESRHFNEDPTTFNSVCSALKQLSTDLQPNNSTIKRVDERSHHDGCTNVGICETIINGTSLDKCQSNDGMPDHCVKSPTLTNLFDGLQNLNPEKLCQIAKQQNFSIPPPMIIGGQSVIIIGNSAIPLGKPQPDGNVDVCDNQQKSDENLKEVPFLIDKTKEIHQQLKTNLETNSIMESKEDISKERNHLFDFLTSSNSNLILSKMEQHIVEAASLINYHEPIKSQEYRVPEVSSDLPWHMINLLHTQHVTSTSPCSNRIISEGSNDAYLPSNMGESSLDKIKEHITFNCLPYINEMPNNNLNPNLYSNTNPIHNFNINMAPYFNPNMQQNHVLNTLYDKYSTTSNLNSNNYDIPNQCSYIDVAPNVNINSNLIYSNECNKYSSILNGDNLNGQYNIYNNMNTFNNRPTDYTSNVSAYHAPTNYLPLTTPVNSFPINSPKNYPASNMLTDSLPSYIASLNDYKPPVYSPINYGFTHNINMLNNASAIHDMNMLNNASIYHDTNILNNASTIHGTNILNNASTIHDMNILNNASTIHELTNTDLNASTDYSRRDVNTIRHMKPIDVNDEIQLGVLNGTQRSQIQNGVTDESDSEWPMPQPPPSNILLFNESGDFQISENPPYRHTPTFINNIGQVANIQSTEMLNDVALVPSDVIDDINNSTKLDDASKSPVNSKKKKVPTATLR